MQGPDSSYPIVMREVARDPKQEEQETAISNNMYPQGGTLLEDRLRQNKKMRKMFQEKQWFDLRDDVVEPWTGTAEEWRALRANQPKRKSVG